jgi:predicted double-glycine peptidase
MFGWNHLWDLGLTKIRPILLLGLVLGAASSVVGCSSDDKAVSDRPVSYLALRFEATIPQREEFTCGAASLATLMTYYWHTPTTEVQALHTLEGRYTKKQIADLPRTGISFDDLIYMSQHLGFQAEGAKVDIDQLPNLAGPVIVNLDKGKLKHFVVLRKVGDGVYYVSDPVVGQLAMSQGEFKTQFTGYIMAVWKDKVGLPQHTMFVNPRDGVRVSDSLWRAINVGPLPYSHGL